MQHPPPRSTLFPYTTLFRSTERGIVLINDKTEHFVKSKSGKSDYDNISFVSNLAPIRLDNTGNNNAELQQKVNKRNQERAKITEFAKIDLSSLEIGRASCRERV